jgi:transcriptional regulator with XRE-family HTH domain
VAGTSDQRTELGLFLRARREQALRAEYGLPPVGRARDRGLRREEIAYLSGVSVTWYTWLEQGRDITPSRQVLDAVARTLHLSDTEHAYLLGLSGYAPAASTELPVVRTAPAHVHRLLDSLAPNPAYAIAPDWGIAGWNDAYAALYPNVATSPPEERNLLWLVFTDPYVRSLLPDWEITSRRFLAEFRAETGPRLGDPDISYQVERLKQASPEFQDAWARYDIHGFESRERVFHHPVAGTLEFEHHQLSPSDHPDLHIILYTPLPGSDSAERLARATRDTFAG